MLAESLVRHVFRLQNHPVAWANLLLVFLYRFLKAIKFNLRNVVLLNVLCCFCESSWCIVAGRIKDPAHRSKVSLSDKSIHFTATCSQAVIFVKKNLRQQMQGLFEHSSSHFRAFMAFQFGLGWYKISLFLAKNTFFLSSPKL